jgi:hypothetical protein
MPSLFQRVSGRFQAQEKQKNIFRANGLHSLGSMRERRHGSGTHAAAKYVWICLSSKKILTDKLIVRCVTRGEHPVHDVLFLTSPGNMLNSNSRSKSTCRSDPGMRPVKVKIADIYVPTALRVPIDAAKVEALALSIADQGQQEPILVRPDKDRYVLVGGLHRMEACKALGETTIIVNLVQARKH